MSFKTMSLPRNILQKIYKVRDGQITFMKVKVEFAYVFSTQELSKSNLYWQ